MRRYDRTYRRYDTGWRGSPPANWYPGAYWAGVPMFGWGWDWPPYAPVAMGGYARDYRPPHRRPERSPTYGSAGDEAARRYARERGRDDGYAIPPRRERGPGR